MISIRSILMLLASLAGGCCLPAVSGRHEHAPAASATSCPCANCQQGLGLGHCLRERHFGRLLAERGLGWGGNDGPGTPPGELLPLPKFHPVPTRPVFEPLPEYALPASLEAVPESGLPAGSTPESAPIQPTPAAA